MQTTNIFKNGVRVSEITFDHSWLRVIMAATKSSDEELVDDEDGEVVDQGKSQVSKQSEF